MATQDDAARLSEMETLLRRLHRAASPQEAVELVSLMLPELLGGGQTALFVMEGDSVIGITPDTRELWPIARDCAASGLLHRSQDGATVAVPVPGVGALALRAGSRVPPAEARLLELFGEHAAAALKPAERSAPS